MEVTITTVQCGGCGADVEYHTTRPDLLPIIKELGNFRCEDCRAEAMEGRGWDLLD